MFICLCGNEIDLVVGIGDTIQCNNCKKVFGVQEIEPEQESAW